MNKTIYFDYNATTPCDPRVVEAMKSTWFENFGNTASQLHSFGWNAEASVDRARKQIASLLGAQANEITFTSGATEANNWLLMGLYTKLKELNPGEKIHFIASTIEHSSVLNALKAMQKHFSLEIDFINVDKQGFIDFSDLEKKIKPYTRLFSIIHINNEIGTIQDLKKIISFCHKKNILVHTDATQTIGKFPFSTQDFPIDFLTCSAHKFYGPKGVGFLYKRKGTLEINPLFYGGGHEKGHRSGTLNVSAIVGAGAAAEIAKLEMEKDYRHISNLQNYFYNELKEKIKITRLNGPPIEKTKEKLSLLEDPPKRASNNINVQFYPIKTESVIERLGKLAFSPGSACQSENMSISHVLKGIGCSDLEAQCTLRFSLGRWTTKEEVDQALKLLESIYNDEEYLKRAQAVL